MPQSSSGKKFVFDALSMLLSWHQAATLYEGLAWCFPLKPGLRPVGLFEAISTASFKILIMMHCHHKKVAQS